MNKLTIKKAVLCCLLTIAFISCSKSDHTSYCPTWLGFTYKTGNYPNYVTGNPRNMVLNPDDSVHVTAHQKERGHLINATYYTWTISYDTLDTKNNDNPDDDVRVRVDSVYNTRTNYDGYIDGADDPVGHLHLHKNVLPPKDGERYYIRFVARYDYSGQGVTIETGNVVDNSSYGGHITPSSGEIGGGAAGYLYFTVSN